jgi:peptidyl-tRNA hydrolase, PTH2 family
MKQAILVRQDLRLPKGKLAAQAAHASVDAVLKSDRKIVQSWLKAGMAKIVLKVKDETELIKYFQSAKDAGIVASLITDAGKTVVAPGTKTAAAIGPDEDEKVAAVVGHLKLV